MLLHQKPSRLLEIRPLSHVIFGYVLGPIAGLTALWLLWVVPSTPWPSAVTIWMFMIAFGGLACIAVELLIVTPILYGYQRYRWWWLNGSTAVAIAFAIGASCSLTWDILGAMHYAPDYSEWGQGGVAYIINGARTEAGWLAWWEALAPHAAGAGMVGGIAALVFRALAIRATPAGKPALDSDC